MIGWNEVSIKRQISVIVQISKMLNFIATNITNSNCKKSMWKVIQTPLQISTSFNYTKFVFFEQNLVYTLDQNSKEIQELGTQKNFS
jgi:hypothetical protein